MEKCWISAKSREIMKSRERIFEIWELIKSRRELSKTKIWKQWNPGQKSGGSDLKGQDQSVHEHPKISKIEKSCYLRAPKELEAHILRIRSTDEYYQHTKYERLTPSELEDRVIFRFWLVGFFSKKPKSGMEWASPLRPVYHSDLESQSQISHHILLWTRAVATPYVYW